MLTPNTVLQGRYQIIRQLGAGGFGTVFLSNDLQSVNRLVVVKENSTGDALQFQSEANILASLSHPNLPRVHDHFREPTGIYYMVMDYIEGQNVEEILQQRGALPENEVLPWMRFMLDALQYLHANRIIHRDIKPQNIIITPQGKAYLVDFGIAKRMVTGRPTQSGARAFTSGFAPPEQYGGGTDQRSDLYSVAATMYAALTNIIPPDALALKGGSAQLVPPRSLDPQISPRIEQAILKGMKLEPVERFQSAHEMRRALFGTTVLPPTQPAVPDKILARAILVSMLAGALLLALLTGGIMFFQTITKPRSTTIAVLATTPPPTITKPTPTTIAAPATTPPSTITTPLHPPSVASLPTSDLTQTAAAIDARETAISAQQTQVAFDATQATVRQRQTEIAFNATQVAISQRQTAVAFSATQSAIYQQQTEIASNATQAAINQRQPAQDYIRWVNQHSQKCLTVQTSGPHIIQMPCSSGDDPYQLWTAPTSQFPLQSKSGVCVYFTMDHAELLQTTNCGGSPTWYIGASSNGYYQVVTGDNLCLDVDSRSTADGAWVLWYPCYTPIRSDSDNQLWASR